MPPTMTLMDKKLTGYSTTYSCAKNVEGDDITAEMSRRT